MRRFLLFSCTALLLAGCASVAGDATQEMAFETPGANDSVCYIDNGDTMYRVWPPETIRISKRPHDLEIRCLADGNREKSLTLEPGREPITLANALNGFAPGIWVDYETGALFHYPKKVVVDFSDMPARPQELPDYHKHLMQNPHLFGMEEFRPGDAALIRDRYVEPYELKKRDVGDQSVNFDDVIGTVDTENAPDNQTGEPTGGSDDFVSDLTKRMNPQVFGPADATGGFVGGTKEPQATTGDDDGSVTTGPVTLYPIEK